MELRMNYSSFTKLKDLVTLIDISAEVLEYYLKNDVLEGKLSINGKYLKSDLEKEHTFNDEIPFSILFEDQDFTIEDVDCVNLEHHIIEGRGVEVDFDILVIFHENTVVSVDPEEIFEEIIEENPILIFDEVLDTNINVVDSDKFREYIEQYEHQEDAEVAEPLSVDTDREIKTDISEQEIEAEKEIITSDIDKRLSSTLTFKDDNLPTKINFAETIPDTKRNIKICYFKDEKELEAICKAKDIGLDKVFKDNKTNDFATKKRIIIK